MADCENMEGFCFRGCFYTQIDAEYAIFIEKCSLCMTKIERWLTMADFLEILGKMADSRNR